MNSIKSPARRTFLRASAVSAAALASAPLSWGAERFSMSSVAAEAAARAGTIAKTNTLRLLAPVGCETSLAPIIAAFEKQSRLKVELNAAPLDDMTARVLLAGAGSGEEFDVAVAASYGVADLAEAEAIVPLSQFAARYEPNHFNDKSLYSSANNFLGDFYGYQTDGDVYLLFINRKLWNKGNLRDRAEQELGKSLDRPNRWSEVDRMMALAHNTGDRTYGGDLFRDPTYLGWEFILRLHETNHHLLDDDMTPQINSDPAIKVAEKMLSATRYQRLNISGDPLFSNWRNYSKGDSLINIGWGGSQKYFRAKGSAQRDKIEAFSPPGWSKGKPGMSYFNWGWNYTVSRLAKQPELAYLFTLFASSPKWSTAAVQSAGGFFDPHQADHYADDQIKKIYSTDFLQVHRDAMERCIPDYYLIGQSQYMSSLNKFLNLVLRSKLSPEEGLNYAADEWVRLHQSIGLDRQYSVWQRLKSHIPNLTNPVSLNSQLS